MVSSERRGKRIHISPSPIECIKNEATEQNVIDCPSPLEV